MNVTVLPHRSGSEIYELNEEQLLFAFNESNSDTDDQGMIPFDRVSYSVYNIKKRTMESILPDLSKFKAADIEYAGYGSHFYFFHLEYPSFPLATFILFEYDTKTSVCREVYRFDDNIKLYENEKDIKIFVLNDQYITIQIRQEKSKSRFGRFAAFLYDTKNKILYDIVDERFQNQGISQFIRIANNVCAIRFGHNQLLADKLVPMKESECVNESICLVSISQLIADILLRISIVSSELIDEVFISQTFSDIAKMGKYITYSRINRVDGHQEIYFYQYVKKQMSMVINNNVYSPKNIFPCVISGEPLLVRRYDRSYEFYRIENENVVCRIPANERIVFLGGDHMVINKKKKRLFSEGKEYSFEILQFPEMKRVYHEISRAVKVIPSGKEELLIFVDEKRLKDNG